MKSSLNVGAALLLCTVLPLAAACGGETGGSGSAGVGGSGQGGGGQGGQAGSGDQGCVPGSKQACYSGPAGTQGIGACGGGTATCLADGSGFGACEGEVTPTAESCASPADDDCDGAVNEEDAGCACVPGSTASCYTGPASTLGTGTCAAGMKTCNADGLGYGNCVGEVLPAAESCGDPGDEDCDGLVNESGEGCICEPGSVAPCYSGPPATEGVGACKGGQQTCNPDGLGFGPCDGEVVPSMDTCGNGVDEDCSGTADDTPDIDGDGWNACNGDCCEVAGSGCAGDPAKVNPGALEILANGDDDDCDPTSSDIVPLPGCSSSPKFLMVTGVDFAQAIDLCQLTITNPPMPQKKWGLISATQLLSNGAQPTNAQLQTMQSSQTAVLTDFGTGGVVPQKNGTMGGLSTGLMRDENDGALMQPNSGTNFNVASAAPAAYLVAHAGVLPADGSCNGACPTGSNAYDPVNVRMSIRVPTNVSSLLYDFAFFTGEYDFACSQYNDFHLGLLQTTAAGNPVDKNIALDPLSGSPISADNLNYSVCTQKLCYTCASGPGKLAGTGLSATGGAGTEWLTATGAVVPGETIQLDVMVFDVSDGVNDSIILVDNFRWN